MSNIRREGATSAGQTPLRLLAVHGELVPVLLAGPQAQAGQPRQRWPHARHIQPVHRHGQRVNGLLLQQQLLRLAIAGLEAGDEDDDGNNDADDDGGGGGDDDVVETLGAAHALGSNFAALFEGHRAGGDFHIL